MPDDMFHGAALQRMQEEVVAKEAASAPISGRIFKLRVAGFLAWTAFSIARRFDADGRSSERPPSAAERDGLGSQAFSASGHDQDGGATGRLDNLHEHEDDKSSGNRHSSHSDTPGSRSYKSTLDSHTRRNRRGSHSRKRKPGSHRHRQDALMQRQYNTLLTC